MWQGRTNQIERPPIAEINQIAAQLAQEGRDLINLGQAVLGIPPPTAAIDRVRSFLDSGGVHGYSPDPGIQEVLDVVARYLRERKGVAEADSSRIILTCGANQAYVNTLLTITRPGDEVVFFAPYYFDHVFAIKLASCVPVEVPLATRNRRLAIDFDVLDKALSPHTRCLTVVSPGNPAGSVVSKPEMLRLCEMCRSRGIWLVADETYDLLTFPPSVHVCPAALGVPGNVCVIGSFSKTFGLAAWRIGYMFGPEEMIEEAIKVQDALVVCAPVPSQLALLGALSELDSFIPAALSELTRRRDLLLHILRESVCLEPLLPDGATFVLAAIKGPETSLAFSRKLLEATGIVTVPGSAFGRYGEGHVRISFGNQSVEKLGEAGKRLQAFERNL